MACASVNIRNHLYYLAVPPAGFKPISEALASVGLLHESKGGWRRLVVEKPFAHGPRFGARVESRSTEPRSTSIKFTGIDHYLGKETVQNILVLRFANGMFEPIWNRNHIDHVQITVAETLDVGRRGNFYEATGALRDMVPKPSVQLLSLVAMEPPSRFDAHSVRSEKSRSAGRDPRTDRAGGVAKLRPRPVSCRTHRRTRGRGLSCSEGCRAGQRYRNLRLRLSSAIDNWRWAGVPFYLRTGKALRAKRTEIVIRFKRAPFSMFRETEIDRFSQMISLSVLSPRKV